MVCLLTLNAIALYAPASNIDSRQRSWYVSINTPIASAVGSRPPSKAVSVFV